MWKRLTFMGLILYGCNGCSPGPVAHHNPGKIPATQSVAPSSQLQDSQFENSQFAAPVMLKAGNDAIRVESPGYAAPCWADVDRDGKKDLLVGQFAGGKMHVYKNLGDGKFAARTWLEASGQVAQVPGVW